MTDANQTSGLLKILVTGNADKKTESIYLLSILAFFFGSCYLSQVFFEGGYSILDYYISQQGGIASNPNGHWFFIIGATLTGYLLIPHLVYIHKQVVPEKAYFTRFLTRFALLLGVLGALGLSFVGSIPEDFIEPHDVASVFAFGGLGGYAFIMMIAMIARLIRKDPWPKVGGFLIVFLTAFCLGLMIPIVPELDFLAAEWGLDPRIFDTHLWQWWGLFTIIYFIVTFHFLVPHKQ